MQRKNDYYYIEDDNLIHEEVLSGEYEIFSKKKTMMTKTAFLLCVQEWLLPKIEKGSVEFETFKAEIKKDLDDLRGKAEWRTQK